MAYPQNKIPLISLPTYLLPISTYPTYNILLSLTN